MKLSYVFLSIGSTGTAIVMALNLFAWLVLDSAPAIPLNTMWYSNWLPGYLTWLSCLLLGVIFWLLDSKRILH